MRVCVICCMITFTMVVHGVDPDGNSCGAVGERPEYSIPLHVSAVFILMMVSGIGIFSTLTMGVFQAQPWAATALQVFKMFGIGVIAGTGWVHLLPDAFDQFMNPCLTGFWTAYGTNFVGVFGLLSTFIVQLIEIMAIGHSHHADKPLPRPLIDSADRPHAVLTFEKAVPSGHATDVQLDGHFHDDGKSTSTVVLEVGILFHSIIIGLTLGITPDHAGFKTLLTAVCFHQLFEGMALGTLLASLRHSTCVKFLVLGLLYPLTTPFGIAIGIAVHDRYNANDSTMIVAQGILNSLSAGILLYNTYAELMSVEINHNKVFREFTPRFKLINMLSMYAGAGAMAIVAIWA